MRIIPLLPRDPDSTPNPDFVYQLNNGLPLLNTGLGSKGWAIYICNTLDDDAYALRDLIQQRLDHLLGAKALGLRNTFDDWADRHGVFTYAEIQAGRKAWMLDLIEEFS